jgi:hypothetical protein
MKGARHSLLRSEPFSKLYKWTNGQINRDTTMRDTSKREFRTCAGRDAARTHREGDSRSSSVGFSKWSVRLTFER